MSATGGRATARGEDLDERLFPRRSTEQRVISPRSYSNETSLSARPDEAFDDAGRAELRCSLLNARDRGGIGAAGHRFRISGPGRTRRAPEIHELRFAFPHLRMHAVSSLTRRRRRSIYDVAEGSMK